MWKFISNVGNDPENHWKKSRDPRFGITIEYGSTKFTLVIWRGIGLILTRLKSYGTTGLHLLVIAATRCWITDAIYFSFYGQLDEILAVAMLGGPST